MTIFTQLFHSLLFFVSISHIYFVLWLCIYLLFMFVLKLCNFYLSNWLCKNNSHSNIHFWISCLIFAIELSHQGLAVCVCVCASSRVKLFYLLFFIHEAVTVNPSHKDTYLYTHSFDHIIFYSLLVGQCAFENMHQKMTRIATITHSYSCSH